MTITLFRGPPKISGNAPVLAFHDKGPYRTAALHASRVIPGPIGELIQRELTAYAEFGYRFDNDGLIPRLAAAVLAIRPDKPLVKRTTASRDDRSRPARRTSSGRPSASALDEP